MTILRALFSVLFLTFSTLPSFAHTGHDGFVAVGHAHFETVAIVMILAVVVVIAARLYRSRRIQD